MKMPKGAKKALGRPVDWSKRDAILAEGMRLFMDHGFERTSVDEISAAAGVSKQTLYRHFSSKEEVLREAVVATTAKFTPDPNELQRGGMGTREALTRLAEGFIDLINSPEAVKMHRLLALKGPQEPQMAEIFWNAGPRRMVDTLAEFLSSQTKAGHLKVTDPHFVAESLFSCLKGECHMRQVIGVEGQSPDEGKSKRVEFAINMLFALYGPDADPPAQVHSMPGGETTPPPGAVVQVPARPRGRGAFWGLLTCCDPDR